MRRHLMRGSLPLLLACVCSVPLYGPSAREPGGSPPVPSGPLPADTPRVDVTGPAAAGAGYPEGTVLQRDTLLPAGTRLPGGAVLPDAEAPVRPSDTPTLAPASRSAVDVDPATGIPYISGGIGVSGREEMDALKSKFNLRLLFAVQGSGAYLADVKVRIADSAGLTLLAAISQGPWFFAALAPGSYVIEADNAGQAQSRPVTVPERGALEQSFYWTD